MTTRSTIPVLPTSTPQPSTSTSPQAPTTAPTSSPVTTTNAVSSSPLTSSSSTASSAATASQSSSSTGSTEASIFTSPVGTSGGTVETFTSFVISSPTPGSQVHSSTSNSFFSNKGAVAGVFSVVGLIVAALAIALIINAVRRRRAKKFDRDVAEAAAEAAASSRSPFDDYHGGGGGGGGGGGYGYSDNSHGTYQLPPLSPPNDAYGASEMSQYDPYAAGAASLGVPPVGRSRSRKESEPGTPGIAGVGAGTLAREPSKRAPYHAFAGPAPQPQGSNGSFRSIRGNRDVLEAAGLAGAGVAAANPGSNGANAAAYVARRSSANTQHTQMSTFGSMSSGGHHPPTLQPGYPVDSYYPHRNDTLSPDPFAVYPPVTSAPSNPLPNPHDAVAPLPSTSVSGHQTDHEEPVESGSPTALRSDEHRMSYQDDTDYSQGNRILRVANE